MKNSAVYARKVKRLLAGATRAAGEPDEPVDVIRLLVVSIMAEDATAKQAAAALQDLDEEYVDVNELRVSPLKDIVECVGRSFPGSRAKAEAVTHALNVVFRHSNTLSLDHLAKKTKREVRRLLREKYGLSAYAESVLTLYGFDGHAIPVDRLLLEALKLDGRIHPDSDLPDLQGFLERIIANKDARASHEALRSYASKMGGRVARELGRRARAEAKAVAAAEAKAKAEAEAKAAAAAEAKAKAEARAAARAKAKAKKAKPGTAKKAGRAAKARPRAAGRSRSAAKTRKTSQSKSAGKAKASKKK